MKENTDSNEKFVALHVSMSAAGATREQIVKACIEKFNLKGKNPRHTYRAWLARLSNPKKYKGIYSVQMKTFQLPRNNNVVPESAAETQIEVGV